MVEVEHGADPVAGEGADVEAGAGAGAVRGAQVRPERRLTCWRAPLPESSKAMG